MHLSCRNIAVNFEKSNLFSFLFQGCVGVLHLTDKTYTLLARSHTDKLLSFCFEPIHGHITTISKDSSIKLWSTTDYKQVYDFQGDNDLPLSVSCNPWKSEFVCGFHCGKICLFSLNSTSLVLERYNHFQAVNTVLYSVHGDYLYTSGNDGRLCYYDTVAYNLLRELTDVMVTEKISNHMICVDSETRKLATVGPTQFQLSVFSAQTLDEVCILSDAPFLCTLKTSENFTNFFA